MAPDHWSKRNWLSIFLTCLPGLILALAVAVHGQTTASDSAILTTAEQTAGHNPADPHQQARLGDAYLTGRGVAKDPARAAYWYRKAADAGIPAAQNQLGYLYLTGIGVESNEAEASKWFARAIAGGSQQGKLNLALIYLEGSPKMRHPSLGRDLLLQLAEKGNAHAEELLGVLYLNGEGVPKDTSVAENWFRRSAKQGNAGAQYVLGQLKSVDPDHKQDLPGAVKLLRKSAHSGYVPAIYLLGTLLLNHPEIPQKRPREAFTLLNQAAEAGVWEASAALGVLARDGWGTARNIGASFRWFLIESKQGGPEAEQAARDDLDSCRQVLDADQQKQEVQAAEAWLAQHSERNLYVTKDGLTIPMRAVYRVGDGQQE